MITAQLINYNNHAGNIHRPVLMLKWLDMDTKENRRRQLLRIIETLFAGKSGQCADALGIKRPQLSRWITTNEVARQGVSEDAARSIEKKLRLPSGTLDADPNETPIESAVPQVPADLLMAWELLTQEQRHEFIEQIKGRADTNREILEQLGKTAPKRPATAVSAGPPSAHAKKPGHRRTGT